ncbi:MAG: hypothetical protein J0M29_13770 [Chitinophagales bacterium]|nr:hypothetical protein [Chitinophagales bacterium]
MNHNDETQIQDYAAGLLSGSQKAEFERRLHAEPDLKAELDLYVAMTALDQQRLKQSLFNSLEPHEMQPLKPGISGKWIWGAAGLLVLILIGVWYTQLPHPPAQPATAQEIAFALIKEAYPPPVAAMGGNDASKANQQQAYLAYRNKRYTEAASLLKTLADQPGASDELIFYTGESCLQTGEWNAAISYFDKVGPGYWNDIAQWRMALALIQTGQKDAAKFLLQELQTGNKKNEVEKLLKTLQ